MWANICEDIFKGTGKQSLAKDYRRIANEINTQVNQLCWDGNWYSRGITDDGVSFGISGDPEGKIYLNPQSWALLAKTNNDDQRKKIVAAIEQQLETPYGPMMLAPSYTHMREDVGRITQKHPGSAENGSVYNHAAIFYIYALLDTAKEQTDVDRAFRLMRAMLPGPDIDDYQQRGQLSNFIPNYYRGAYYQIPKTAGRSSQLFNTGTVSWYYRTLIEKIFGLVGCQDGLTINPQLPSHWQQAKVIREFRGSTFDISIKRRKEYKTKTILVNGNILDSDKIKLCKQHSTYQVEVNLPLS